MPVWQPNSGAQKNTFQVFFFQLYFIKKYVDVAINDFTKYLIILIWLRKQKCRQLGKTMRKKDVKAKEEIKLSRKVISFI